MASTDYHGWPLPEGTSLPLVHIDIAALGDAIDKELPIVVQDWAALNALPPIMDLKALRADQSYRLYVHNGTQWIPQTGGSRRVIPNNSALVGDASNLAAKVASGEVELVNFIGSMVGTTDGAGYIGLHWPVGTFPNGVLTATWGNGDTVAGNRDAIVGRSGFHAAGTDRLVLSIVDSTNTPIANRVMRFEINVWGW
jgi:hypothetical protein